MNKEAIPLSPLADILREVKRSRQIKKVGISEGITVKGGKLGFDLEHILSLTDEVLPIMNSDHSEFINTQARRLGVYLSPVSEDQVTDAYTNGLHNYMKLRYRVARETHPEDKDALKKEENIRTAISAFTIDFVNSLRMSERLNILPSRALQLARLSYRHDPQSFANLLAEFPSFQRYVVLHAAIYYPSESRQFLVRTTTLINKLKPKFPEIEPELLTYVAVNFPTRAENYLLTLEKLIPELIKEFPEFEGSDVRLATIHHSVDPRRFLKTARKAYGRLKIEFSDLPHGTISYAVLRYPLNPRKYLNNFKQILGELRADFPDFSNYFIVQSIFSRYEGSRTLLTSVRRSLPRYRILFPNATDSIIKQALIFYPSDPDSFINKKI